MYMGECQSYPPAVFSLSFRPEDVLVVRNLLRSEQPHVFFVTKRMFGSSYSGSEVLLLF